MARYIGPVCKLCRREGMKLFLKGERCYSEKCSYTRRPYPPGQQGSGRVARAGREAPAAVVARARQEQLPRHLQGGAGARRDERARDSRAARRRVLLALAPHPGPPPEGEGGEPARAQRISRS